MIPSPTIVAVDDRADHLDSIVKCLSRMGYSCLPLLYKDGNLYRGGDKALVAPFSSIQLLFLDIEYVPSLPKGPQTYDMVATVLEKVIGRENGPYTLITWSTFPDQHAELMRHLSTELNPELPAPAASALLDKNVFLTGGADTGSFDYDALEARIREIVENRAEINALMGWADAARDASGDVVQSIVNLVPREDRFTGGGGEQLSRLLTAIAREGGGKNACEDLTSSMNEGLGPILIDRVMHATRERRNAAEAAWRLAIPTPETAPELDNVERAALNTMTAISEHEVEHVPAGSRGAVCSLPERLADDDAFKEAFGGSPSEVLSSFLVLKEEGEREAGKLTKAEKGQLRKDTLAACRFLLVGKSAACDHAWGKVPIKKLLLALEVPQNVLNNFAPTAHGAMYQTPVFRTNGNDDGRFLVFNWRYKMTIAGELAGTQTLFRLREPLISHLITGYHVYGFRIGIPKY